MGLERIAAVLQGVHDNYDIDLFKTLIAGVHEHVGRPSSAVNQASPRVIADHLRATSFLIADGVLPSNEGRGYVLRRIMRRAMRHAHLLGAAEPAIFRLVPTLVHEMGQAYPELGRAEGLITETLRLEEGRFQKTLARGLTLLEEASRGLDKGDILDGETAFKLYDTYGFPLDLTQDALKPRGIGVDLTSFTDAMERQRAEARKSWAGSGEAATESVWLALRDRHGATEFLGYEHGDAPRRRCWRSSRTAPRSSSSARARRARSSSTRRRSTASPAARSATPARSSRRTARASASPTRRRRPTASSCISARSSIGGFVPGQAVQLDDRRRRGGARSAPTIPRRIFCTRRCGRRSARTSRRRARSSRPTGCASTSRIRSRCRTRRSAAVEDIANAVVLQDAPVETRLMDRDGAIAVRRDGALRREIRRRGARRLDGQGTATAGRPARPIRSSFAAARMSAAPARSAS